MKLSEMRENIIDKYSTEKEKQERYVALFDKCCDTLPISGSDAERNFDIIKIFYRSLMGIVDKERVKQSEEENQERARKAILKMTEDKMKENF